MLCTLEQGRDLLEHITDENDDTESCEGFSISLVASDEAPAPRVPGKGSFHDPASWQQDKPALCLRQFDDVQRDAFGRGGICGGFAGVALIDIGKRDAVARGILDIGSKTGDGLAIADISRRDSNACRCRSVSTDMWTFEPRLRLAPS